MPQWPVGLDRYEIITTKHGIAIIRLNITFFWCGLLICNRIIERKDEISLGKFALGKTVLCIIAGWV